MGRSKINLLRDEVDQPSAIERVQLARHERRPYALDYIERIFTDFVELHGDRRYRDDPAIVGGWGLLDGRPVMIVGHQKGRHVKERLCSRDAPSVGGAEGA